MWPKKYMSVLLLAVLGHGGLRLMSRWGNVLSGFSTHETLSSMELQLASVGLCFSPLLGMLDAKQSFADGGYIAEGDYTKDSIYSILYSLYQDLGKSPSPSGVAYQFTFNTWGISDVAWLQNESEPQRHGKAAYQGLIEFEEIKDYLKENPNPRIVEIGCGTGAGANFISQMIPGSNYTALDMQQAAIDTCNHLHARHNPRLTCQIVPGGVGGSNGNRAPVPDNSVDIVIISETHIAEETIGPEERAIFKEIIRILKPGAFFLWGNALPTRVWRMAEPILAELGMGSCGAVNHTQGAIKARIEDKDRVDMFLEHLLNHFPVMAVPHFGQRCARVVDIMVKNFYRHPGTDMFQQMVTGAHSYMHLCQRLPVLASA